MTPKVIIKSAKPVNGKKRYYVLIKAANGKTLSTSETLNSKASARKNARATLYTLLSGERVGWYEKD